MVERSLDPKNVSVEHMVELMRDIKGPYETFLVKYEDFIGNFGAMVGRS